MQLHHVDVADRDLAIERLAGAAVEHGDLPRMVETREIKHLLDVSFFGTVEHWRGDRHAVAQIAAELDKVVLGQGLDRLVVAVDSLKHLLERTRVMLRIVRIDGLPDLESKAGASPAKMRLEDLADVHSARHTKRIEHDVDLGAILKERHILDGYDLRNHALVTVTAGHFIAGLYLAFHRDEDLDHLHDAGRKLVPTLQLLDLVRKRCSSSFFDSSYCLWMASISAINLSLGEANSHHCERGCSSSTAFVILESFLKPFGPAMPVRPSSISARRP